MIEYWEEFLKHSVNNGEKIQISTSCGQYEDFPKGFYPALIKFGYLEELKSSECSNGAS